MKCTPGGAEGEPAVAGHPGHHRPAQPAPQPWRGLGVLAARTAVTATTRFLPARAKVWSGLGSSFSDLQWIVPNVDARPAHITGTGDAGQGR